MESNEHMIIVSVTVTIYVDGDPQEADLLGEVGLLRNSMRRAGDGHADMLMLTPSVTGVNTSSMIHFAEVVEGEEFE